MPGDGELGPLFPHKVERQFSTSPNPERNQGRGISGRAHPGSRVIRGHVHRSCKKINSILNCGERGERGGTWPLISSSGAELGAPSPHSPVLPSPEVETRRSDGSGGGGPAESPPTCGHRGAAPEQQQPRAAPHGREEPGGPGPGGCGREPSPLGCGMKRQQSSGGTGALYFFLLLGRRARSVGAGGGEPRARAAPGGGVTLAHRPGGAGAPLGRREPRDHSRPGGSAPRSGAAGSSAASPGFGARSSC